MVLCPCYVITYVIWDISFDEISVLLDCCITGLWHPINKNYVFKTEVCLIQVEVFKTGLTVLNTN